MFNKDAETIERLSLRQLQTSRLRQIVKQVYEAVPFYRQRMNDNNITPDCIQSLDDLVKLPFTTKQDMRDAYPYGMLAKPLGDIVRLHSSSGTTGKPTVVAYTEHDLKVWSEVLARTLAAGGLHRESVFQVAVNYGLFTGGLGMNYAAERIGATVVPISSGNTKRQITLMQDFGTTAFIATPSYTLYLAEVMQQMGVKSEDTRITSIFCGAETWSDDMKRKIEMRFGVKSYDVYGLSEIIGPGVSFECECQQGLHINEDHFLPEVIDPLTGKVLPAGQEGELVITTLTKEGMPMIRYRTRDLTTLDYSSCSCGRTLVRMKRVLGRSDDMLIIRGVNLFPSQVESVLLNIAETEPHYQLVVDRENNLDILTVLVEASKDCTSHLEAKIKAELASVLGLKAQVKLLPAGTIQRSEGKAKRVIDNRKI